MERETFDRFTRLIGAVGSRRAALRLVASAALLGGATIEGTAAKRRRKRGRVRAQQSESCESTPTVCASFSSTGCEKPEGNCDNKRIGRGANLTNCNFRDRSDSVDETNFAGSNLTGTCWFQNNEESGFNFRGTNLTKACFFQTNLSFSDFRGSNLKGATFCFADLVGADFRGSNLTADQLAQADDISCSTILPNGKSAEPCGPGLTCCIECVDTETDFFNCGKCGHECPIFETCSGGTCQCGDSGESCAPGLTCCNGECVEGTCAAQ